MLRTVPNASDAQRSESAFTFSLPLPTIAPLTRDPNLQPLYTGLPKDAPANRLTTLNVDVQNHIMSALSTPDLAALMRTCRYLSEAALLPLCARSYTRLDSQARVASFYQFLRINSGPSSRTPYIKALWLDVPHEPCYSDHEEDTYLGILRHCHHVRRLRLISWYQDIKPPVIFHIIATSIPGLEELNLFVMPNVTEKDLRKLVRLPLRKLQLIGNLLYVPNVLSAITPLARTLTELGHVSSRFLRSAPGASFPGVKRLNFLFDLTSFVGPLTATFPAVTHLRLWDYTTLPVEVARALREPNKQRWQEVPARLWRSLKAIWATNIWELYAFAIARHAAYLSVPFDFNTSTTHMLMLLELCADMHPNSLEVRIDLGSFVNRPPRAQLLAAFEATVLSCVRLTLRFETFGSEDHDRTRDLLLDTLETYLPKSTSLTHLLLRHVPVEGHRASQPDLACIPVLAKASETLRWIGLEVDGALHCWEVTHPRKRESADNSRTKEETILVEMSEDAGRRVLAIEQMDEFRE
ncbi:hypothetical protein C8T65DRAFT_742088 [Cerioporus squamosus]|nr:hypothetical protein C8T65DRAFT_742088 [Cerioporus squamosus]